MTKWQIVKAYWMLVKMITRAEVRHWLWRFRHALTRAV